ncbi:transposase family protein [Ensifer sp. NPDC090286]|uniref:integrase catalytic domain-containing protein n=1 Tax=Ensifer sp. NPDC090286 TaxID=3363991 RepID=UPI00383A9543
MTTKMTRAMRMELANAIRGRYSTAAHKDKRRILDEFIAATGYHEKSAIRVLNSQPAPQSRQTRQRTALYDEAVRSALIILWEASDRVCGKRLKALLPILLPALERNGHLLLEEEIRHKILSMSAATIDRLLRMPRRTTKTKKPRIVPEPRRRIKMRTFADWNEPHPGSMEMDLVAHCGGVNRGSYVHSLVLTDIASGWTEAAPIVVREGSLVVETLERIRVGLPFALRALDVDNGSEFVNNRLIEYCLAHGIELTRARPYRKNDQAWIEQKNGAVVRKLLGYRRFEGLAAARAITRLYGASRLFVNFFQPSFKLAAKHRDGAKVAKRYHPPQTPCERLLQAESTPVAVRTKLSEIAAELDPLKLLEEMRAVQAYLAALADGEIPPPATSEPPNLAAFVASLSSAWHAGEIRPTFSVEAKPRYLRSLQKVSTQAPVASPTVSLELVKPSATAPMELKRPETPNLIYAEPGQARIQALRVAWPIACRRLEELPNINAMQLFEELCTQFPGRFTRKQYKTLARKVSLWRQAARARGVVIGSKTYRRFSENPRGRRPDTFKDHWEEMAGWLEDHPDQTALELLVEFQARYPGQYSFRQLRTLQKRVRVWRMQAVQRLIDDAGTLAHMSLQIPHAALRSNILDEANGNKIT